MNGQANSMPRAIYQTRLASLPTSAVDLATGSVSAYPEVNLSMSAAQIATLIREKAAGNLQVTATLPAQAGVQLRWDSGHLLHKFEDLGCLCEPKQPC